MTPLDLLDSPLCEQLTVTLGHFLWQGLAVGLLIVLAAPLLRRTRPPTRYGVYVAALLLMAACPPTTFMLLGENALPEPAQPATEPVAPSIQRISLSPDEFDRAPRTSQTLFGPVDARTPATPVAATTPVPDPGPTIAAESAAAPSPPTWHRYAAHAVLLYLVGVAIMLARLLLALRGGQRLRRRSQPVDDPRLLAALARQAKRLSLTLTPAIAYCERVAVPTVVGILRPMILLPASLATGLTADQVELLLAHELAHIRRYDHLINLLQRLIEAALFFHPAIWFVSRRIRIERELCCDDMVIATGARSIHYADSLVRMAELGRPSTCVDRLATAAALGAADRTSRLHDRVIRLIEGPSHQQTRLTRGVGLLVGIMVAVTLTTAVGWEASRSDQPPGDTSSEQATEATRRQPSPDAFTVTFHDGVRVELAQVASSRHNSEQQPSHAANGKVLEKPFLDVPPPLATADDEFDHFQIVVRLSGLPDRPTSGIWQIALDQTGQNPVFRHDQHHRADDKVGALRELRLARRDVLAPTATVRYGVATGPWTTGFIIESGAKGAAGMGLGKEGPEGLILSGAVKHENGTLFDLAHNSEDREFRLVSYDRRGRKHLPTDVSTHFGRLNRTRIIFDSLEPDDVGEVHVQFCMYRWAAFHNVSLRLGHETNVVVQVGSVANPPGPASAAPTTPEIAPGFAALLEGNSSPWLNMREQDAVTQTYQAYAAEVARLEAEKLRHQAIYENLRSLDAEQIQLSPEMRHTIQQDPRISKLQERKDDLELELEIALRAKGDKHRDVAELRAELEVIDEKLAELTAQKEAEEREYMIYSAEKRYFTALQAELQLRERLMEVEEKKRDLAWLLDKYRALEAQISEKEQALAAAIKAGKTQDHPDVARLRRQLEADNRSILMLRESIRMQKERQHLFAERGLGPNHRQVKDGETAIAILEDQLRSLLAQEEAEEREFEIDSAQRDFLSAVQDDFRLRRRLLEAEARQRDLDQRLDQLRALEEKINDNERALAAALEAGKTQDYPDVARLRRQIEVLQEAGSKLMLESLELAAAGRRLSGHERIQTPDAVAPGSRRPAKTGPDEGIRKLTQRIADGDVKAIDELERLADAAYKQFKETESRAGFDRVHPAFDLLGNEAAEGNDKALQALVESVARPHLRGFATQALGPAAGKGNETALEILLHPDKHHFPMASAVSALKPAADALNRKAIDLIASVVDDGRKPLWLLAAQSLSGAAARNDRRAIDALIHLAGAESTSVRREAIDGLRNAARKGNLKAQEVIEELSPSSPSTRPARSARTPRPAGFVYLGGKVQRPGTYALSPDHELTLSRLVFAAGGVDRTITGGGWAFLRRRMSDGTEKLLGPWQLADIMKGREPDITLAPNDFVHVSSERPAIQLDPASGTTRPAEVGHPRTAGVVHLDGKVLRPGAYALNADHELTLSRLIMAAGGVDRTIGDGGWASIRRRMSNGSETTFWQLAAIMGGSGPDVYLKPNDVVRVTSEKPSIAPPASAR